MSILDLQKMATQEPQGKPSGSRASKNCGGGGGGGGGNISTLSVLICAA